MIRNVAGIEKLHGERAPGMLACVEFHRVKLVVEQADFAADEVCVEVVRLEAIHDGGAFVDPTALELQMINLPARFPEQQERPAISN